MSGTLQKDGDNPGWVKGWGVYRMAPWDLAGVFSTAEEAEAVRLEKGESYKAAFGSHLPGTDDFVS